MPPAMISVVSVSLLFGFVAGAKPGTRSHQASLRVQTNISKNVEDSGVACLSNTGGTCNFKDCSTWRGSTVCRNGMCVCDSGLCSSVSGRCAAAQNELVSQSFTLRNARHSDRFLTLPSPGRSILQPNGVLSTTDRHDMSRVLSLYALPIADDSLDESGYLLASQDGEHLLSCDMYCTQDGCSTSCDSVTSIDFFTDLQRVGFRLRLAPPYQGAPPGVQSLTVEVVHLDPRGKEGHTLDYLFMDSFGALGGTLGIHGGGGVGAIWIADAKIPGISLPYDGPKCTFDCGAFGSGTNGSSRYTVHALGYCLGFALLACICLCPGVCLLADSVDQKPKPAARRPQAAGRTPQAAGRSS